MSTLLEVSGISINLDGFRAINNLTFQIGKAELRDVIGANGASKTTFMVFVTGKANRDEGQIIWAKRTFR